MLYPILMAAYHQDSTDPRDPVFVLLGLVRKNSHGDDTIKPDYDMSAEEVYINVTVHFLRTRRSLDILLTVLRGFTDGLRCNSKRLWKLPSWVPNWQIAPDTTLLNQGRAISQSHPQSFHASLTRSAPTPFQFEHDRRILKAIGILVDHVDIRGNTWGETNREVF